MRPSKHHGLLASALLLVAPSCQADKPETQEDQYIPNPNPGVTEPFCRWTEEPTPPEGMVAHRIGAGAVLDGRNSCDDFGANEIDEILIEEYESNVVEGCDYEPFELLRGCYDRPFGGDRCLFSAYLFSTCALSASSG